MCVPEHKDNFILKDRYILFRCFEPSGSWIFQAHCGWESHRQLVPMRKYLLRYCMITKKWRIANMRLYIENALEKLAAFLFFSHTCIIILNLTTISHRHLQNWNIVFQKYVWALLFISDLHALKFTDRSKGNVSILCYQIRNAL